MTDVEHFLRECVFYPCSEIHGTPIKFLSKRFRRFLYADYKVDRERFDEAVHHFKGYRLSVIENLNPEKVFGVSWKEFEAINYNTISQLQRSSCAPYLAQCLFERESGVDSKHGPASFELMFACTEAISTFQMAFSRRGISPKCLVHVRSGIGFGGNFSDYPHHLGNALLENSAGLPPFVFYDRMGSDRDCGDYLSLVELYDPIETWGYRDGGFLRLARLKALE